MKDRGEDKVSGDSDIKVMKDRGKNKVSGDSDINAMKGGGMAKGQGQCFSPGGGGGGGGGGGAGTVCARSDPCCRYLEGSYGGTGSKMFSSPGTVCA